jgi:hypothetical protein
MPYRYDGSHIGFEIRARLFALLLRCIRHIAIENQITRTTRFGVIHVQMVAQERPLGKTAPIAALSSFHV